MTAAVALRHALHAHPELSGQELATSERVLRFFAPLAPDEVLTGLGGTGVAFAFGEKDSGPTVLLRCELDALPIQERNDLPYRSQIDGKSHKCGHDGHMAILAAVGERLARQRPAHGRVVLLFQPAEETGAGARAVVADPGFGRIRPDLVFGLHNIPGFPLGQIVVREGTFTCASRGMRVRLRGKSAHAAQPETGRSPAAAMSRLVRELDALPADLGGEDELVFATVVGAQMGGPNFGVVPDLAEVCATLRAETNETMAALVAHCEARVQAIAESEGLAAEVAWQDVFAATVNAADAVALLEQACEGLPLERANEPFRWSEDFGCYTEQVTGAFFGLGAGEASPDLHNDDYDFPDELVASGADIFLRIVNLALNARSS